MTATPPEVEQLLERANTLGSDPRNTNYAGGNASAKGTVTDPVTARDAELMWVKGSGGDLGTLTEQGLAVLRLDRMRALVDVYPGVEREDEMVAAFDYCLHGRGGAAPSIDTAMHGLVDAAHVDHLHPDSGIAIATAADGEELTRRIFGDRVAWVPWRRPGFQLGLDIAEIKRANPQAIGVVLGGHGITAWGDTSEECQANSLDIIRTAEAYIAEHGKADPFGEVVHRTLPEEERRARAAALFPLLRGLASTDRPQVGHFTDSEPVLDFVSRAEHPRLAALGTSCPDHFLRTKVRPMVLDLPPDAPLDDVRARLRELHAAYREEYAAYYDRHAAPDSPPMRGADPAIVLVPGVGMFSFGADKQTARVAGEFYVNAINVMRGAEALSSYAPIDEAEKFRIEYWSWRRRSSAGCRSRSRWPRGSRWSPAAVPASAPPPPAAWPPRAPASWSPTATPRPPRRSPPGSAPVRCAPRTPPSPWAPTSRPKTRSPPPSATRSSPSAASTSSSTTPGCRSRSRCWRRPPPTGTCSTTSWRAVRSSSRARPPAS